MIIYVSEVHSKFANFNVLLDPYTTIYLISYIEGNSLKMCSVHTGVAYFSTVVDWGSV